MKYIDRSEFIHDKHGRWLDSLRDIIFGAEDGMVSTLGALTGIAIGSQDRGTIVLAGLVIISVESLSMGIGSFLSSKSMVDINKRRLAEEGSQIVYDTNNEVKELEQMYVKEGWPKALARQMSQTAKRKPKILLAEMKLRELHLAPKKKGLALFNGLFMFIAYVVGGLIPVSSYFFLPFNAAVYFSIAWTLLALFVLGCATSYFTKRYWLRSGLEMLLLAGIAAAVGYFVGQVFRTN